MAQPVTITISHELGRAEAKKRVEASFGRFKQQIATAGVANFHEVWDADRVSFTATMLGQRFTGRLDVHEKDIRLEVDLPAFLANIAERFKGRLKKEGQLLLEKK